MNHSDNTTAKRGIFVALVIVAYVGMVAVNGLANAIPIGGRTTGAISDEYLSLFTPAGFTFSIWGLIYSGLFVYSVVQALPRLRTNATLARMDVPFVLNAILNAAWIISWHYAQLGLSMLIMLGLLGTLIVMHREAQSEVGALWRFAVLYPVSVYFAWICMATIANLSILQSAWGLNDALLPEEIWTIIKLFAALSVCAFVYLRFRNVAFVIVVAWAAFGIQANQVDGTLVQVAAMVCAFLCAATILIHIVGRVMGLEAFQSQTT